MTRRHFTAGCLGVGSTTLFSSLTQLGAISAASAQTAPQDYKALVCILLAGGNDSFNLVAPAAGAEYAEYRAVRSDLALPQQELLPLEVHNTPGRAFGLHPAMSRTQALFTKGGAAVVTNVGTLVEPVTRATVASGEARLPLGLFSHADQIEQWQTSVPQERAATGWGGRLADLLAASMEQPAVSMSISLGGTNVFQSGRETTSFAVNGEQPNGAINLVGYGERGSEFRDAIIDSLLNAEYAHIFEQYYARRLQGAIRSNQVFSAALGATPPLATAFADTRISRDLAMTARTIAARQALGMRRQTFFVQMGDFDHHDEVLAKQQRLLGELDQALGSFVQALDELGVAEQVTVFTISDFGRTLTSNGRGSDHAWGGNQLALGGAIRGGHFYGEYPALAAGNPLDVGRGRLIPTTSADEYFAELALWFGVAASDLEVVLPNIGRFYTPSAAEPPMGFLASRPAGRPRPPLRSRTAARPG